MPANNNLPRAQGENEILTVRQAAERLKINTKTLKKWIKEGLLVAYRLNSSSPYSHLRIRAAELNKLLIKVRWEDDQGLHQDTENIPRLSPTDHPNVEIRG